MKKNLKNEEVQMNLVGENITKKESDPAWVDFTQSREDAYSIIPEIPKKVKNERKTPFRNDHKGVIEYRSMTIHKLAAVEEKIE